MLKKFMGATDSSGAKVLKPVAGEDHDRPPCLSDLPSHVREWFRLVERFTTEECDSLYSRVCKQLRQNVVH